MLVQKRTIIALMILVLAVIVSSANGTDYWDTGIPAGGTRTMTVDLQGGQTVSGLFNITGSGHQVKFWVRDPTGAIILDSGTVISPVNFEFTAGKGGTYVLNFDNSEWGYQKHVFLGYDVSAQPILGLDPIVFIGLVLAVGIVLAILAFAFYRRSHTQREATQSPPPPPTPQ
jgi:hypothetical protein